MIHKIFLTLTILFMIVGCNSSVEQSTDEMPTNENKINETTSIPKYKYSDDFYNRTVSMDSQGNTYFMAGYRIYKMDTNNDVNILADKLIDNIYLISDIKCYNDKLYLLVLKVNQYYTNGKYGLAKMDLDGSNFKYLNDLSFLEEFTNTGLRIEDDKIYALEPYNSNGPRMYIYSIKDETFEETEYINIDEDRYNFYKKEFPDYPYTEIQHIYNNCFYTENTEDNGKTTYVMYDPINKTEKKFDIDQYGERNKTNNYNAALSLVIDHLNDSWYLFSPKGVIKFNNEFEKEQVLLDETYNDKIYRLTSGEENIIKCELVDSDIT